MKMVVLETQLACLKVLQTPYTNEITEDSPRVSSTHASLKVPLRPHQCAAVKRMLDQEKSLSLGWDLSGQKLFGGWSILGDGVGVGKSLTVLSHIAHLKDANAFRPQMPELTMPCSPSLYSLKTKTFTDISNCEASLIIVPHTLYRQWATYISSQTKLNSLLLTSKRTLEHPDFMKNLMAADVILVSNTMYSLLTEKIFHRMRYKRVYIDEADTIRLTCYYTFPESQFLWLISASWPSLLFPNQSLFISYPTLLQHLFSSTSVAHPDFKAQFKHAYDQNRHYYSSRYPMVSAGFFKNIIFPQSPLRGNIVVRSSMDFINTSITLPPLYRHTIICRAPASYHMVSEIISPDVRNFLHAGDTQSALEALGVSGEGATNLVEAVTENRVKELDRLKKTYDFKASIPYSTPAAKEASLANLKQRIDHLDEQIRNIKERIENYKQEVCPICFDEPSDALLTNCCQRIFCAACILTSLTRSSSCPLCRTATIPSQLKRIMLDTDEKNVIVTHTEEKEKEPMKKDALFNIIKENPNGKFLVFSRYDNPFIQIAEKMNTMDINVKELKGNKDVIQSTLNSFQKGDVRCLLLNSTNMGAGLTITAATHVILLHAMNIEEEKQILGRAYRLGRKEPLTMYKLVHPDEIEIH